MANPQCEHGFTRIANELLDAALLRLSAEETVMWLALVRVTYGYGRKEAAVTREQLAGMCGQSPRTAARALAALAARGALYIQRNGPKPMTIRLEKDYEKWVVTKEVPDMAHQGLKEVPDMAHQGPKRGARYGTSRAPQQLDERNKKKRDPQPSLEAMDVAQKYHARIRTILPSLARSIGSQADEKGAVALDALVRIDGHDWELVKSVLRWALTDDFWSRNLRSLASARTRGKNGSTKFENCLSQFELRGETVRAHGAPAVQTITHTLTEDELSARRAANALWKE